MTPLERDARLIAARKMGLVKDPEGLKLPDDLWRQALPDAEREMKDENRFRYLADEPPAVIPKGYAAPLDTRTTLEMKDRGARRRASTRHCHAQGRAERQDGGVVSE